MLLCAVIGYGVIGVEEAAVEVEQPFGAGEPSGAGRQAGRPFQGASRSRGRCATLRCRRCAPAAGPAAGTRQRPSPQHR